MNQKKQLAVVGLSGGVDSAVAALIMQEAGWNVVATHMLIHKEKEKEAEEAEAIANRLKIPFHRIDLIASFESEVSQYLSREYLHGRTPNPCIVCNRKIKFGALLDQVEQKIGKFDCFVTGHFARPLQLPNGRWTIEKGADNQKDQAYFLAMLTQAQIAKLHFPLFGLTKTEVRQIALAHGLEVAQKKESQDLCTGSYLKHIPQTSGSGDFIEISTGKVIGEHRGIEHYTIGQRRGLRLAMGTPVFVVKIDPQQNRVFIGTDEELLATKMKIEKINWVGIKEPPLPWQGEVKIRYRDGGTTASLIEVEENGQSGVIQFQEPVRAITPGQLAVAYENNQIAFAGFIAPFN